VIHLTKKLKQTVAVALVFVFSLVCCRLSRGAIANGSLNTNSVAQKENLNLHYYEAQVSLQEKLKVGRERYEQKMTNRARVIAAMVGQFRARQEAVEYPKSAPLAEDISHAPGSGLDPAIFIGVVAMGAIVCSWHFFRRKRKPGLWKPGQPLTADDILPPSKSLKLPKYEAKKVGGKKLPANMAHLEEFLD
jgi:hypothetical protein